MDYKLALSVFLLVAVMWATATPGYGHKKSFVSHKHKGNHKHHHYHHHTHKHKHKKSYHHDDHHGYHRSDDAPAGYDITDYTNKDYSGKGGSDDLYGYSGKSNNYKRHALGDYGGGRYSAVGLGNKYNNYKEFGSDDGYGYDDHKGEGSSYQAPNGYGDHTHSHHRGYGTPPDDFVGYDYYE